MHNRVVCSLVGETKEACNDLVYRVDQKEGIELFRLFRTEESASSAPAYWLLVHHMHNNHNRVSYPRYVSL